MHFATALGYLGALSLGLCAAPLVWRTVRDGHARGVDPWFLGLWLLGEAVMLAHVSLVGSSWPVFVNYAANVGMVGLIGWYKVK